MLVPAQFNRLLTISGFKNSIAAGSQQVPQDFAIIFGIFDDQNRGYILDCHCPSSQRTSAHLPRVRFRGDVLAAKSPSPERWAEQGRALIVGTSLQQETGKL